ncbi:hypothetical protein E4U13_005121 [Claviceps humidiphila]|uniref:Threonine/serine exporter-like N-terminal domain-containing protein n=1 Tax=Claviceps humidiphila TaxID=1294629 RepID=A0A9P7TVC7_9HYPO|nr:hypothetical protein E4U13_005121 [Claviceps humidiphila]
MAQDSNSNSDNDNDNLKPNTNSNSNSNFSASPGAGAGTTSEPTQKSKKRVVWLSSSQSYAVAKSGEPSPLFEKDDFDPALGSTSPSALPALPAASASGTTKTEKVHEKVQGTGGDIQLQPLALQNPIFSELNSPDRLPTPPGAPDAGELRLALNKVLTEDEQRRQSHHLSPSTTPRTPRPALRRNTSYDVPEERERADQAEKRATERQLRSMNDARQRADRLAVSVGSYSAHGSRRNSGDEDAFHRLMDDSGDHDDHGTQDDANIASQQQHHPHFESDGVRRRAPQSRRHRLTEEHAVAEKLVRSHIKRGGLNALDGAISPGSSGTNTPLSQMADSDKYVSRPSAFRGGILSSLLKLYQDDRRASNNNSGQTTPLSPSTPVMSPRASPPASRPSSAAGGGSKSRLSGGLFSINRARHSTTSLTELVKSSSMLAAPGSSEISETWSDSLKKESTEKSHKSKKAQIRITVHIAGIIARHRYLLKLCRALMMYGAPTHRLEEYMTMSSRVLEIEGQFLYIPGCMIISFDDSTTHTAEVKLVRVMQGIDLGKLRDVHDIYKDVVHDKLGVEEAARRLDVVLDRRRKFQIWFLVLIYGLASACVAPFAFEGRLIDLPIAFILGCIVGLLQLVFAANNELYAHVFEVSAAVVTSFLARGFGSIKDGQLFCFSTLAQSSIALILPGYMVLCSSLELQSHNIVAGSMRMVYAMIYTLFLGYGITIGASLYGMMDSNATSEIHCQNPLSREWYFLFVPGFTLCLCIINQAKWKQTPVMLAMAIAGFCVNSYCTLYFSRNSQIPNMLGALTVGIMANLYSRLGGHVQNLWLDFVDFWTCRVRPRLLLFSRKRRSQVDEWPLPSSSDPEVNAVPPPSKEGRTPRKVGYSLAAAAMLPAIFVQVPSGLAATGSLLAGITTANELTGNRTSHVTPSADTSGRLDGTAFNVLFSVIQVAIGLSVGLFMSALIVYPLGKRRSGLFSF